MTLQRHSESIDTPANGVGLARLGMMYDVNVFDDLFSDVFGAQLQTPHAGGFGMPSGLVVPDMYGQTPPETGYSSHSGSSGAS